MNSGLPSLRAKIFSRLPKPATQNVITKESASETPVEDLGDPFAGCVSESDSDGSSSVGDHLVSLNDIDLDSQFFSQPFTQPEAQAVPDYGSLPEERTSDDSVSEGDTEESGRINVMLTQLVTSVRECDEAKELFRALSCKHTTLSGSVQEDGEHISKDIVKAEQTEKMIKTEEAVDEDWEQVHDANEDEQSSIEIIINQNVTKSGKVIDVEAQLRRLVQSERREKQLQLHKVHLLCLIGHGFYLNKLVNELVINNGQDIFNLLSNHFVECPDQVDLNYLKEICGIFVKNIKLNVADEEITSKEPYVLLCIALMRFLTIEARLVMNLNVLPKNTVQNKTRHQKVSLSKATYKMCTATTVAKERYPNVPLTTAEILKRKPEFINFSQVPQTDGAEDESIEEKRPRLDLASRSKPSLWKLKLEQPVAMKSISNKTKKFKMKAETTSSFFSRLRRTPKLKDSFEKPVLNTLPLWIEVYLSAEKCWVTVDILSGRVDCLDEVVRELPQLPVYVYGWSNDGSLQDVTARYWWQNETGTRRQRVADKWLQTLEYHNGRKRKTMPDLIDQQEFRRLRFRAPVPEKAAEFKNHPSYCLKRDLLKFQALYPPDAPPLGFFREEPIYARECVHTLHSREVWLRHAKVIRMFEQPYKVVWSKLKREKTELELFGYWQTEEYVPPEPKDGRVPRNAFGNIELFMSCMLPKGTVHLKQINIPKTCRRLNVDYAPAVVGFGIHAGGNHPVFEGIVICKEFEQQVLQQYELDQVEQARRKHEKKEQIIYDRWKKMIRGLLIRCRLKDKYNFDDF